MPQHDDAAILQFMSDEIRRHIEAQKPTMDELKAQAQPQPKGIPVSRSMIEDDCTPKDLLMGFPVVETDALPDGQVVFMQPQYRFKMELERCEDENGVYYILRAKPE